MHNYPKISIVTPNFNGAKFLEETILSVLNQNYPNLEYIIIDGNSTDESVDIIKKYQDKLAYWISERDTGMYQAIQKGFEQSTGEVMGWINSDDKLHSKALFTIADIFANNPIVDWIEGTNTVIDLHSRTVIVQKPPARHKFRYFTQNIIDLPNFGYQQQESSYWRRSLWQKNGSSLNTNLKLAGDFALWMGFFNYTELYQVDALIGAFRFTGQSQMSVGGAWLYKKEAQGVIDFYIKNLKPNEIKLLNKHIFLLKFLKKIPKFGLFFRNHYLNKYFINKKIVFDASLFKFKIN